MIQDDRLGWKFLPRCTARFDIESLAALLAIFAQLRKEEFQDPYQFIDLFDSKSVNAKVQSRVRSMNDSGVMQYDRLFSEQYGITVPYQRNGYDKDWIAKCLSGILALGLGYIRMIGPLVALGSQSITDAILDLESFTTAEGLVTKIQNITTTIVATGQNTRGFLAKMYTGEPAGSRGNQRVLPLKGDDKQDRSIQVVSNANDRGGASE